MSDVSITDLIAEARKVFRESPGWELGIQPGTETDLLRRLADALESVTAPTEDERIQWAPSGDVTQGKPEEVAQFLASSDGKVRGYAWGTGLGFIFQTEHGPIEVQPGDWISRNPDGRFGVTSVTAPTEDERALAILAAHGFHDPRSVLEQVNEAIIDDLSFTARDGVSHALWSMGGWIKHKGCPNNPKHGNADAEYENGCKTCEIYLLAVADALLAVRTPVTAPTDATAEMEWAARFTYDGLADPVYYEWPDLLSVERFIKNPPLWFDRPQPVIEKAVVQRSKAGPWVEVTS